MNLPIEVIEAVNEARCVLFVGSRFSGEAIEAEGGTYPDNRDLAKDLGWTRPKQLMGTRQRQGIITPSVTEGAKRFEAGKGREGLLSRLGEHLATDGVEPTAAHEVALRRFPLIVTTNYDDLLERAATKMGGKARVMRRGDPFPAEVDLAERVIYKLRGGFDQPESLVATVADYQGLAHDAESKKSIRKMLRKKVVFFVGYKPDEEEFELLWNDLTECYGGELPRCHLSVAQGRINDYLWQKWVWRGLLMFTADPDECMEELEKRIDQPPEGEDGVG
jgi:hypothetical protein